MTAFSCHKSVIVTGLGLWIFTIEKKLWKSSLWKISSNCWIIKFMANFIFCIYFCIWPFWVFDSCRYLQFTHTQSVYHLSICSEGHDIRTSNLSWNIQCTSLILATKFRQKCKKYYIFLIISQHSDYLEKNTSNSELYDFCITIISFIHKYKL